MTWSVHSMQRVLVLGSGGAGKTTVAKGLARATGLPLVHLDALFWRQGWEATPTEQWRQTVSNAVAEPRWIMDGNYGGTLDLRIAAADTVIFLDTLWTTCIARLLRRRLRYSGRSRPSMPAGCPERLTFEFLWWVCRYPRRRRPAIVARLRQLEGDKVVHILRGDHDVQRFLAQASKAAGKEA